MTSFDSYTSVNSNPKGFTLNELNIEDAMDTSEDYDKRIMVKKQLQVSNPNKQVIEADHSQSLQLVIQPNVQDLSSIKGGKSTVKFSKNQFFVYWLKKYFEPSKISYIRCYSRLNFSSLKFRPFTEALRNAYLRQIPICLAGTA